MDEFDREAAKFYDKIRQSLQQQDALYKPTSQNRTSNDGPKSRDKPIFGRVTKEDMEQILKAHEEQQSDPSKKNKATVCDENVIKGGSYAKMLHANTGFHHLGSTEHLINILNIDDSTRSSFLGDYNTFAVSNSEDIDGLKKKYLKATIRKIIDRANIAISENKMQVAQELIEHCLELDRYSGLAKTAKGKYLEKHCEYEAAAREFREALQCEDIDRKEINMNLSNALHRQAMIPFYKEDWHMSEKLLTAAVMADPDNQAALLHLNLARDKLRDAQSQRFPAFRPAQPSYRR